MKLKPILYFTAGVLLTTAVIGGLAFNHINEADENVDVAPDGRLQYKWYVPQAPKSMSFAGEKVPLERWDIKEQLERELLYNYYNQYSTLYILRLTERYFPVIEPILKANGIPQDFKYLCIAESALRNQTSSAGAVGFWQFMPGTAPSYGLEINGEVDERYDVEKSTVAACKYFNQAYEKFGSWTAAAASYNMGQGGYNGQSTFQQRSNYYDLQLPEETMRYVFRILTFKLLVGSAEKFGYIVSNSDAYKPIKTRAVEVNATIPNLAQFALDNGSNYRMLKQLNPWLRDRKLTVKGKNYTIVLPASN
ncbi:MAG TPA: lytic transglycosylase domain-containing protein [Flavipsychrobacter sp.]|nr:lytic transglycosylase domain-containing protein [Flavipsychrobacter sp.]